MTKPAVVMLTIVSIVLSLTGGTATAPVAMAAVEITPPLVSSDVMARWTLVAQCETHQNWTFEGANWDGGLGISRTNWNFYGGKDFAPAPHLATPEEQVAVARRIQARAGVPDFVPDQDGLCRGW